MSTTHYSRSIERQIDSCTNELGYCNLQLQCAFLSDLPYWTKRRDAAEALLEALIAYRDSI